MNERWIYKIRPYCQHKGMLGGILSKAFIQHGVLECGCQPFGLHIQDARYWIMQWQWFSQSCIHEVLRTRKGQFASRVQWLRCSLERTYLIQLWLIPKGHKRCSITDRLQSTSPHVAAVHHEIWGYELRENDSKCADASINNNSSFAIPSFVSEPTNEQLQLDFVLKLTDHGYKW